MTGWRDPDQITTSLHALADRAVVTDDLADRLIDAARAHGDEVVPLRPRRRTWLVLASAASVAALSVGVVALASHGTSHTPPALGTPTTPVPTPTPVLPAPSSATDPSPTVRHTASPSVSTGSTSAHSSTPPSSTPRCTPGQLQVGSTTRSSQSGDSVSALVVLTNTGAGPCTLSGYPTVVAVTATGTTVGHATAVPRTLSGGLAPGTSTPSTVLLRSGGKASTVIAWSAAAYQPNSVCVQADHAQLTPPGAATSLRVPITTYRNTPWRPCDLQVTPVVAGSTGTGT